MSPVASAEALAALEFPAILEVISSRAAGALAAERIRALEPDTDRDRITAELARVGEVVLLRRRGESLDIPAVPDLRAALGRLRMEGGVLDIGQLHDVRRTAAAGRAIATELERVGPQAPALAVLHREPLDRAIERRLERSISDDGELLDTASPGLAAARREVHAARERLIRRLDAMLRDIGTAGAGSVTVRSGRYVIPVRRDARPRPEGIIHDESGSAGTLFIEPTVAIELGNALRGAVVAEEREILAVLRELSELLRPALVPLGALHEMAVMLDTLVARGSWAHDVDAEVPMVVAPGGALVLRGARHPLLLARGIDAIPFDLDLRDTERTLLITGPNTGGKTVLLKTVGLASLLAQAGVLPALAAGSTVPILTAVFVDIGDHQSIAADLSTFSAHVAALRAVLTSADRGTLVILDEVGSGTDPAEGGALAMAVLEELTRRGSLTIATTHLGALKSLAGRVPGVVNGSLQFDGPTLSPTYRFTKGVPGRSYGLAIARRLGLDPAVLASAEALVPESDRSLDQLLASVEARDQALQAREANVEALAGELANQHARMALREQVVAEREDVLLRAEREAERERGRQAKAYLLEARKRVEDALALAKGAADEAQAREARRLVEEGIRVEADRLDEAPDLVAHLEATLAVGSAVRLSTGAVGEVVELRSDGRAVVQVGGMRLVVKAATLTPVAGRPRIQARPEPLAAVEDREANWELNLRGLRADEAQTALLAALDGAVLAEQPYLRIIHGMGTGALRDLVQRVLGGDRRVASHDFAPRNQGGTGVTIAVFR